MSETQALVNAMGADVQQRLAPVFASFNKVVASIETSERLLPITENMQAYTTVYNIATDQRYDAVLHEASEKLSEFLYNHFQELLETYARQLALRPLTEDKFARVHAWAKFRSAARWACRAFSYLSNYFLNDVKRKRTFPPLDDAARAVFFNCCLKKHLLETRRAVFDLITEARDGDLVTVELLRSSVDMFKKMNIPAQTIFFEEQFLVPFLEITRNYYDRWSASRVSKCTASEYIQMCGRALQSESDRLRTLLTVAEQRNRLLDEVEAALLDNRAARELIFKSDTGLRSLLRMRDFATAAIAFKLLSTKAKRIEPVAEMVAQQLEEDGRAQLEARRGDGELNPHECVSGLFELHETYTRLLHDHFENNVIVGRSVQSGFEKIMSEGFKMATGVTSSAAASSSGTIPVSEILAMFCDYCIRQQDKLTIPLETSFDQAIALLMFTTNRDIFQARARELLSRRLLAPNASAMEAGELLLVQKLKRACGGQFTGYYEGMLADRGSSAQLQQKFQHYVDSKGIRLPMDFNALVLRTGIWPLKGEDLILTIPREVAICIKYYVDFHKADSARRTLKWLHNHSNAVITAKFTKGMKELSMTAYQAGVLLAFNTNGTRSIKDLKGATNLDEEQVRRAVGGLAKLRVILPSAAEVHQAAAVPPGSIFIVNDQFTHSNRKLVVPTAIPKVSVAASKQLQQNVDESRKQTIQATIVRILKSRQQIAHQDLMAETMRGLAKYFTPDPRALKDQIEYLIDRSFISRHPTEQGVYVYVA